MMVDCLFVSTNKFFYCFGRVSNVIDYLFPRNYIQFIKINFILCNFAGLQHNWNNFNDPKVRRNLM